MWKSYPEFFWEIILQINSTVHVFFVCFVWGKQIELGNHTLLYPDPHPDLTRKFSWKSSFKSIALFIFFFHWEFCWEIFAGKSAGKFAGKSAEKICWGICWEICWEIYWKICWEICWGNPVKGVSLLKAIFVENPLGILLFFGALRLPAGQIL